MLPHIYEVLEKHGILDHILLDGELYIHGELLQDIGSICRCNRTTQHELYSKVEYHLFDCFDETRPNLPFPLRYSSLCNNVKPVGPINFVETHEILDTKHANTIYYEFLVRGYEGAMYRVNPCIYRFGARSQHLLKRKKFDTCRARVLSVFEGEGKYKGMLGGVTVESTINEKTVTFNVGSGFDDAQRRILWNDICLIIGKTLQIQYQRLNKSGKPQAPTLDKVLY